MDAPANPAPRKISSRSRLKNMPVADDQIVRRSYRIYVDETGLETWQGHRLFGFAGVAGFGPEILRADRAWKRMKREHFGGENVALHASRDALTDDQQEAISSFFRTSRLRRFSYVCEAPPIALPGVDALKAMQSFLINEVVNHLEELPKVPEDFAIVFETSERLSPKIMETFPGLAFAASEPEGVADAVERPIVIAFTDKAVGLSTLEMADQIAYRAQREMRPLLPNTSPAPAFRAVFPAPPRPHARSILMRVASAKYEGDGVTFAFPEPGKVAFRFEGPNGIAAANRWLAQFPGEEAEHAAGLQYPRKDDPAA